MKLHTKIAIGLGAGIAAGGLSYAFFPDSAGVQWIGDNIMGPVGQIFLRMLFMTVVPIVFGVDRVLDMSRTTLNVCGDLSAAVFIDRADREMEGTEPSAFRAAPA